MPGLVRGNRKRPSTNLSEDDDASLPPSSSSSGNKRARYDRDASQASESPAPTNGYYRPSQSQRTHDDEDFTPDPHQPGSIVRVKLRNFVTYTAAEFHPGPSLNMIIGPNGTGKSTLVCAICLGLGWETKNLGRAKEIGEFVKHGCSEATIEVELAAGASHNTNPVIRRTIRKEGNKSTFHINGRSATQKEVIRLAKSFSVQIDNLCQFLPQDRVADFARLDSVALLGETLRAAAPEQMITWHEELKNLRSEEKRLERSQTDQSEHLRKLKATQDASRDDVRHWNDRQDLIKKAKALDRCRPIIESRILRDEFEQAKTDWQKAAADLRELEAEVAPAREAQADAEKYQNQIESVRRTRSSISDKAKVRADQIAADIRKQQDAVAEYTAHIEAERGEERQRRQDLSRIQAAIANIERSMQDKPVETNEEAFRAKRTDLRAKTSAANRREGEVREKMDALTQRARNLTANYQRLKNERASLDTQSGQQASRLQSASRDTATAWEWFQANRNSLQLHGEVHGPPIVTCSVTDPTLADAVETSLRLTDATAITCTDGRDSRLLSRQFFSAMKLHQISMRTVPQPLASYRSPVTRDELAGYGFDSWMLDHIQGPDPVLAMLCDQAQIHRTAFSRNSISNEQFSAIERSPIANWIAGGQKYRISRRREYGQSSTSVTNLNKAKVFTNQPVDAEDKQKLDHELKELDHELLSIKEQHEELKGERQQARAEQDEAKSELETLKEEENRIAKAKAAFDALPSKKADKERELEALEDVMRDTRRRVLGHKVSIQNASLKAASLAVEYAKAVTILRQMHENLVEVELRSVEAIAEVEALEAENAHILEEVQEKTKQVNELKARRSDIKNRYNRVIQGVKDLMDQLSDEESSMIAEFQSRLASVEELDNEVEAINSKLGLMADGNVSAVHAYEKRGQEIEKVEGELETLAQSLEETKVQVSVIREQWEPRLDGLVAKISDGFSHNFAQIGCAGQVDVYKDEDFENWSIQIQVRFRENEPLSILNSMRQSGGERAVSTVFYLMALQDLARAPFRVVDEINQGMDPRNERKVHERMVDVACREHTSQYFLITPKLLSNLKFHPKMTVHCIASGEHMPAQGHESLDFGKMAKMAVRIKRSIA